MDAHIFKELFPKEYVARFLQARTRPDGRRPDQARQVEIEHSESVVIYRYAETFISLKYELKAADAAEQAQPLSLKFALDSVEELGFNDRLRLERYLTNTISNVLKQTLDLQKLCINQETSWVIQLSARVAGSDGSLLSHLISAAHFLLWQIKINDQNIVAKEIKAQAFAQVEDQVLVDPTTLEEKVGSSATLVQFLDQDQFMVLKTDGVPMPTIPFAFFK